MIIPVIVSAIVTVLYTGFLMVDSIVDAVKRRGY